MSEWKKTEFGIIPSSWEYKQLENYFELITYGFTNPMPTTNEGPFMLTTKDIYNGKINYIDARKTSWKAFETNLTNKSKPKINDILITKDGSTGRVAIVDKENICVSQSVAIIRPNNKILPLFLKYLLETEYYQQIIDIDATGSTIKHIYITKINKMYIGVPELKVQARIVDSIHSIQMKIDLLQQNNKTLEELAETLFRQWFVENSETNCNPGRIKDICKLPSGFSFKSSSFIENGVYKIITIKNVQNGFLDLKNTATIDILPSNLPDHCKLKMGDILLSLTGNVGRVCRVTEENLLLNQRVSKVTPLSKEVYEFCLVLFSSNKLRTNLEELARGTAQSNLSPIETLEVEINVPKSEILLEFHNLTKELFEKHLNNNLQIQKLETLRDTLLPKLMSGTVRVEN